MPGPAVLVDGIAFGESPRWIGGRLWYADWGAQRVVAVDASGTPVDSVAVPSAPCCFDVLPDGRLLVVSGTQGTLLRREPDGSLVPHADLSALSDKPWNDIVVDAGGRAYVNGIGVDFPGGDEPTGLVAAVEPDGRVRKVAGDLAFPNGMAVTPDGSTLVVAESHGKRLTAFDIGPDGDLSGRRVWADLAGGVPDGICLDAAGAAWYADVPAQRCVRVREGGEVLQTVELDRGCFACMLGGPDGRILFIVAKQWTGQVTGPGEPATGQLLTLEVDVPHAGRP